MVVSQEGYQALDAHRKPYVGHDGRDGLPAVWECLMLLLQASFRRPRSMGRWCSHGQAAGSERGRGMRTQLGPWLKNACSIVGMLFAQFGSEVDEAIGDFLVGAKMEGGSRGGISLRGW